MINFWINEQVETQHLSILCNKIILNIWWDAELAGD